MPMQVRFLNQPRLQVRAVALPGNVISVFGRQGVVVAQNGDYTASQVTNVPSGSVTSTNVQGAIDELATGAGVVGAALTAGNDTNVTASLGGTPATALLRATSITLGWTGTLAVPRGGIGTSTLTSNGVLLGAGTGTIVPLSPGSTGTFLRSPGGGAAPTWAAGTSIFAPSPLLNSNDTNITVAWSGASLTAVNGTTTLTAGWTGTLAVARGGTGTGTWATNTIIVGGTTATGTFQQVASGASGTFLKSQGAGVAPIWATGGGGGFTNVVIQSFTASGTYTPTSGMNYCIVEAVGGGGGGGGVLGTPSDLWVAGGGGSGGYSRSVLSAATIGATKAVTIGAAGSAGSAGDNDGGNGGDTSLSTLVMAKGGSGGRKGTIRTGGAGGIAGTGTVAAAGTPGAGGFVSVGDLNHDSNAGGGGSSFFGGGAASSLSTGNAGSAYGGGGSAARATTVNTAGGAGAPGIVVITEFCS